MGRGTDTPSYEMVPTFDPCDEQPRDKPPSKKELFLAAYVSAFTAYSVQWEPAATECSVAAAAATRRLPPPVRPTVPPAPPLGPSTHLRARRSDTRASPPPTRSSS